MNVDILLIQFTVASFNISIKENQPTKQRKKQRAKRETVTVTAQRPWSQGT